MISSLCFTTLVVALKVSGATVCTQSVNVGVDITQVSNLASSKARSNWEWGTQAQTLLELSDPHLSVFSDIAFPNSGIPKQATAGTTYAKRYIKTSGSTLTAAGGT